MPGKSQGTVGPVFYYAKTSGGRVIDAALERKISQVIAENADLLQGGKVPDNTQEISAQALFGRESRPRLASRR